MNPFSISILCGLTIMAAIIIRDEIRKHTHEAANDNSDVEHCGIVEVGDDFYVASVARRSLGFSSFHDGNNS